MTLEVAIVHDYLTQRGGAERVVLSMHRAFPEAPIYTSLYEPDATFPAFSEADVRASRLNHSGTLRRNHRLALPFLATAFGNKTIRADALLCSSSGWAHGARTTGTKIVYFHAPARWLYQRERYLAERSRVTEIVLGAMRPLLVRWDKRAAADADIALTQSRNVAQMLREAYGLEAELLPPPPGVGPAGRRQPVGNLDPGFYLCISRLLPYKNVQAVVEAFADLPSELLVVAGVGPELARLRGLAGPNVRLLGGVADDQLRWLYASCVANISASHEDFGLTPLEAAAFGKPSLVLRGGGFLDTVLEGQTGEFFDAPATHDIVDCVTRARARQWSGPALKAHAAKYSEERFVERLRETVRRGTA